MAEGTHGSMYATGNTRQIHSLIPKARSGCPDHRHPDLPLAAADDVGRVGRHGHRGAAPVATECPGRADPPGGVSGIKFPMRAGAQIRSIMDSWAQKTERYVERFRNCSSI